MLSLNDVMLSLVLFPIVDAGYEGMQKRVFLVTMLLAFIHIPFIIETVLLYSKLGPKSKQKDTEQDEYKYTKLESVQGNDENKTEND